MGRADNSKKMGLERFSERIILITGLLILFIVLIVSYDVLLRYFLNEPQLFVDDLSCFLLVVVTFLGAGPTFYRGGHIRVDLVTSRLKPRTERRLRVVTLIIGIALSAIVIRETMVSTLSAFKTGRVSAVMVYPLWIPMIFVPLGMALMVFFMIVALVKQVKTKGEKGQEVPKDISGEMSH